MAEEHTPPEDHAPKPPTPGGAKGKLTKPVGPFPLGVWVVIIVGGLGIGWFIRRNMGSRTHPATATDVVTPGPATQGASSNNTPTVFGPTNDRPKTNSEWLRVSTDYLVSQGQPGALVGSALQKYLDGKPLTAQEVALVNMAIRQFGAPPDGAPPITMVDGNTTPTPNPAPTDLTTLSNDALLTQLEQAAVANRDQSPYIAEAMSRGHKNTLSVNDPTLWKANGTNGNIGQPRHAFLILAPLIWNTVLHPGS